MVAAYPYIPGSGSEAFKGIGVFVGLMMSIGASGVVNQAVSGLMLMYTRALKPGEFVQIGETEGTVKSIGFLATRIETLRHEEINIPNAVIASSVTRNYSRLAAEGGVWIPTKVTIGYDTPWRQVQAMLALAAEPDGWSRQGAGAARACRRALMDFYVEYTLLVSIAMPNRKNAIAGSPAREHPGRVQRVRRADHVAQLRGRSGVAEDRAEGEVVRAAGGALAGAGRASERVADPLVVRALEACVWQSKQRVADGVACRRWNSIGQAAMLAAPIAAFRRCGAAPPRRPQFLEVAVDLREVHVDDQVRE